MSFYGKVKRVQSSPFVFDKYYPNRKAMEDGAASDGVYIGRYVLVKYTCKYTSQENDKLIYFDKYDDEKAKYKEVNMTEEKYSPNTFYIKSGDNYLLSNAFQEDETYYILEKYISDDYTANVNIDINIYKDTFDGTVWQKIYTAATDSQDNNSIEKYIMVADLHASVPRLELIEPHPAPKYFADEDGQMVEKWRSIEINEESSSEDAYSISIPEILHLEVGDTGSNLFNPALLKPAERSIINPEVGPDENGVNGHDPSMFDENNNYMRWKPYYNNVEVTSGDIDEKRLESKLNGLGQAISDVYDVLYGVPSGGTGQRPFFIEDLSEILSQYDKGLVGILSSIATDIKGDPSKDYAGRKYQPGMYYYFISKWGDATEDPDNFIENIPRVIGSGDDYTNKKSHYKIDFNNENWTLSGPQS